jgi:VanZ family protein
MSVLRSGGQCKDESTLFKDDLKMKWFKMNSLLYAWTILVLIAIAWPSPSIPEIDKIEYSDKIIHLILFGVVTFLANGAMKARGVRQWPALIISFAGGSVYAGLAEIIQLVVPGRSCSIDDFYAGSAGALLALLISYFLSRKGKRPGREAGVM